MSEVGQSIIRGLKEALAFADGTGDPSQCVVHIPPEIDVKAIRGRLGLTQQEFAARFWFSMNALNDFERGSRVPDGPTRAYLMVIDREPEAVQKALRIA
jgi:putative transcriptional regulator